VLEVLELEAVANIHFVWESYAITPDMYGRVAELIRDGRIEVHGGASGRPSSYYSSDDSMAFAFEEATSIPQQAMVIHEATHAACDAGSYSSMNLGDSECMAYLAQCTLAYQLDSDPGTNRLLDWSEREDGRDEAGHADPIFDICWALVPTVIQTPGTTFNGDVAGAIREPVAAHPWYADAMNQSAGYRGNLRPSREALEHAARIGDHFRPRAAGSRPTAARSYGIVRE